VWEKPGQLEGAMKGWMGCLVIGLGLIANVSKAQVTLEQLAAAEAGQLAAVSPEARPQFGTFYSWQKPWQAPSPANFFSELTLYDLGDGHYLLDDRELDYAALSSLFPVTAESEGGAVMSEGVGEGCGLWLGINRDTSSNVVLTLHNTRPSQTYQLWSLTNLALTNWMAETNVTGASGTLTDVLIPMHGRTNLFLKATEYRDYQVDTNSTFSGLGYAETGIDPPDSMGAVGPQHFVELLNGQDNNPAIAVYTKSGALVAWTNTADFFRINTNYPSGSRMVDPRILYDHQHQRWVACAIDIFGSQQVLLAVSNGDSPTNLSTGWTRHLIDARRTDIVTDFTTLGLDGSGLYISVSHWLGTNAGQTIVAIKKPEIYQGILITNRFEVYVTNTLPVWIVQPAVNFDESTTNDYAWFVVKGPPDLSSNYQGGAIYYRRMQWTGTNAAWAENNWIAVTNSVGTYRDYYDLDGTNIIDIVPSGISIYAPNKDGVPLNLHTVGSRLAMTSIRNGYLWTCQPIGLSGTNGTYTGNETGTNVDRTGAQWLRFRVDTTNGTLSYDSHGRIYDQSSTTNAFYYYFPSLAVNCAGDMVLGFSGSSADSYIGAYYSWRTAGGASLEHPRFIQAGRTNYAVLDRRWGDYSATTSDPVDDWSFWSIQQYADPSGDPEGQYVWKTVIAKIRPAP